MQLLIQSVKGGFKYTILSSGGMVLFQEEAPTMQAAFASLRQMRSQIIELDATRIKEDAY